MRQGYFDLLVHRVGEIENVHTVERGSLQTGCGMPTTHNGLWYGVNARDHAITCRPCAKYLGFDRKSSL